MSRDGGRRQWDVALAHGAHVLPNEPESIRLLFQVVPSQRSSCLSPGFSKAGTRTFSSTLSASRRAGTVIAWMRMSH